MDSIKEGSGRTRPDLPHVSIQLPDALVERINRCCRENSLPLQEFLYDAVNDKLMMLYKERRKKQRL